MSEARDRLDAYLARTGLARSTDAAQQFQVTLMRQWASHLDEVLAANHVEPGLRSTIIREFIYGAVPQEAEAELRQEMTREMKELRQGGPFPPEWRGKG
jgi:hypothetical protein